MATAEHREPCGSRGSCTVLGAPGGEIPPGDSTRAAVLALAAQCRVLLDSRRFAALPRTAAEGQMRTFGSVACLPRWTAVAASLVRVGNPRCMPPLGSALVADEVKNTVRNDRGIEQEGAEVTLCPGLAEIAEKQIDHESLLDCAE